MFYLTFNDYYSGVYNSQVIDTARFLNKELNAGIHLVAFISIRNFFTERKKIKSAFAQSIVLPMFPGVKNWQYNFFMLLFITWFLRPKKIIARGPFATVLAQRMRRMKLTKEVCFDARGAYAAEFNEYHVVDDPSLKTQMAEIEQESVQNSDFRLAVSIELVKLWKSQYYYGDSRHVVVPCTLDSVRDFSIPDDSFVLSKRKELGFCREDIILTFSGSSSAWHSFDLMNNFLSNVMRENPKVKLLLLSKGTPDLKIINDYSDRVVCKWVKPDEVFSLLSIADYGVLLREKSVTNTVSSPTKFAEYLSAGLKILISEDIGDYTNFTREKDCGHVIHDVIDEIKLSNVSFQEKGRMSSIAKQFFTKQVYKSEYQKILQ